MHLHAKDISVAHSEAERGKVTGTPVGCACGEGVFTLRTQPPGEYRWVAYNDSAFKEGQVNADFVTTYGLGRNFQGEASGGVLRDMLSGQATAVSADAHRAFLNRQYQFGGRCSSVPSGI